MDVRQGDVYLLCSDGLTKMCPDKKLARMLGHLEESDVDDIVNSLIDAANSAGGRDNISVVVIHVGPMPEPADVIELSAASGSSSSTLTGADEQKDTATGSGEETAADAVDHTSDQIDDSEEHLVPGSGTSVAVADDWDVDSDEDAIEPTTAESDVLHRRGRAAKRGIVGTALVLVCLAAVVAAILSKKKPPPSTDQEAVLVFPQEEMDRLAPPVTVQVQVTMGADKGQDVAVTDGVLRLSEPCRCQMAWARADYVIETVSIYVKQGTNELKIPTLTPMPVLKYVQDLMVLVARDDPDIAAISNHCAKAPALRLSYAEHEAQARKAWRKAQGILAEASGKSVNRSNNDTPGQTNTVVAVTGQGEPPATSNVTGQVTGADQGATNATATAGTGGNDTGGSTIGPPPGPRTVAVVFNRGHELPAGVPRGTPVGIAYASATNGWRGIEDTMAFMLPPGEYKFRFSVEGFEDVEQTAKVVEGNRRVTVTYPAGQGWRENTQLKALAAAEEARAKKDWQRVRDHIDRKPGAKWDHPAYVEREEALRTAYAEEEKRLEEEKRRQAEEAERKRKAREEAERKRKAREEEERKVREEEERKAREEAQKAAERKKFAAEFNMLVKGALRDGKWSAAGNWLEKQLQGDLSLVDTNAAAAYRSWYPVWSGIAANVKPYEAATERLGGAVAAWSAQCPLLFSGDELEPRMSDVKGRRPEEIAAKYCSELNRLWGEGRDRVPAATAAVDSLALLLEDDGLTNIWWYCDSGMCNKDDKVKVFEHLRTLSKFDAGRCREFLARLNEWCEEGSRDRVPAVKDIPDGGVELEPDAVEHIWSVLETTRPGARSSLTRYLGYERVDPERPDEQWFRDVEAARDKALGFDPDRELLKRRRALMGVVKLVAENERRKEELTKRSR